jgi:hypothetical protein
LCSRLLIRAERRSTGGTGRSRYRPRRDSAGLKPDSGGRERIDFRPVGGSTGGFAAPAMTGTAFAQACWPSLQRPLASIESTPGRHSAGISRNSGTTIAINGSVRAARGAGESRDAALNHRVATRSVLAGEPTTRAPCAGGPRRLKAIDHGLALRLLRGRARKTATAGRAARVRPEGVAVCLEPLDAIACVATRFRAWRRSVGRQVDHEVSCNVRRSVWPRFRSGFRPTCFGADTRRVGLHRCLLLGRPGVGRGSCLWA